MNKKDKLHSYGQSGVQGFFGITKLYEYVYQKIYQYIPGYNFTGSVFVSKTITLHEKKGNTELSGYKMKRLYPKSIYVSLRGFIQGYMLNAVGLSNTGLLSMVNEREWLKRKDFFHLSLQLEGQTNSALCQEIEQIARLLEWGLKNCNFAIQLNESCPNTGHAMDTGIESIKYKLSLFKKFFPDIKIWIKFNALISPIVLVSLENDCAGFVVSNTIPYGEVPDKIDWKKLFPNGSPIARRLKNPQVLGGLSGTPVYPVLVDFLKNLQENFPEHNLKIIAGGGVFNKQQIDELASFNNVVGIALGCVATLRPWRVQGLIAYINQVFSKR